MIEEMVHTKVEKSTSIIKLIKAWMNAKTGIGNVIKFDKSNDHFGNEYVSLSRLLSKVNPVLLLNNLVLIQMPGGDKLTTLLMHDSGEFIQFEYFLFPKNKDPQGIASATTYARRHSIESILSLSGGDADDDGNEASRDPQSPSSNSDNTLDAIRAGLKGRKSEEELKDYFSGLTQLMQSKKSVIDAFKARKAEIKLESMGT